MSDSVIALTNAINAYTAAVNAKLGNVAQQVAAAVTAAQAEDKTAIDALTAQVQAETTALG